MHSMNIISALKSRWSFSPTLVKREDFFFHQSCPFFMLPLPFPPIWNTQLYLSALVTKSSAIDSGECRKACPLLLSMQCQALLHTGLVLCF